MSLTLNTEILNELKTDSTFTFFRKVQRNTNNYNYFTTKKTCLKLYNCKVVYVDTKTITLQFEKKSSLSLLILMRAVHHFLRDKLNSLTNLTQTNKTFYSLVVEGDDTFTIRCYLPHHNRKYFIDGFDETGNKTDFILPRINNVLTCVCIDIRNIWETTDKLGYNLEVKSINYN